MVPNQYGLPIKSDWEVSTQAYVQPSDYLLASGGLIAYSGRTQPAGDLSLGFNWAQLDVGYRAHWLSPATDNSMLLSTEAPTIPSVTLSNWEPLTRLGFQYEFFLGQLQQTSSNSGNSLPGYNIDYNGVLSRGNPRLFGTQLSIEPFPGWSLGVNRLVEYGGGSGLPDSASFLAHGFFNPSGKFQTQANQQASYVSRFIFPGKTPFAVYFQYAGEDNSDGGSYLLGNAALTAGIDFPKIWHHFDLTYEYSEWQNIWYVHNIFLDGMTNYGVVLGNWGADQRRFGDGVGARSQMLRVGWEPPFGGYLEERVRTVANQSYYGGDSRQYQPGQPAAYPYHHYYDFSVTYSRPWNGVTVGGEALAGRDVYGQSFSRLSGFVRYGGDQHTHDGAAVAGEDDSDQETADGHGGEIFVDAGAGVAQVHINLVPELPVTSSIGHRSPPRHRCPPGGLREERLGRAPRTGPNRQSFVGGRTPDRLSPPLHRFVRTRLVPGSRSLQSRYAGLLDVRGIGAQWRNFLPGWLPKWDLGFDLRHAQNIARDHVLATDPRGSRPDSFYKIDSAVLYLSRRF